MDRLSDGSYDSAAPGVSILPGRPSVTTETASALTQSRRRFVDLPPEIREMIWRLALPEPRTVNLLVYAFPGMKLAPLNRRDLKMPLSWACFESRRVVREAGYFLAFRDMDNPDDTGVWFNPKVDVLERTLWGPGEDWEVG